MLECWNTVKTHDLSLKSEMYFQSMMGLSHQS